MEKIPKTTSSKLTYSIIIPTWKRPGLALLFAENIRRITDAQIIIIDQENDKPSNKEELKKRNIFYFPLPAANTSHAKNVGIEHATGDIIFFFDDDAEITPDTIPAHLALYNDPGVIGTAGMVINDGEEITYDTNIETGKTNFFGTRFSFHFRSAREQDIDFPYGCNMSFRKSVLNKVHGFDEDYGKVFEEVDLASRARAFGRIRYTPEAVVYHHKAKVGGTRGTTEKKNRMLYYFYGLYLRKRILFPFSLVSLLLRTRTVLKECPYAVGDLYQGYFRLSKFKE